jgi:hypothetical protein
MSEQTDEAMMTEETMTAPRTEEETDETVLPTTDVQVNENENGKRSDPTPFD